MILSRYCVVTEPFLDERDQTVKHIVFGTRKAQRRVIDAETWQRIVGGAWDSVPRPILHDLVEAEILVPPEEDELAVVLGRNAAAAEDEDVLYLVIEPTAQCQLGCDYCGQEHTPQLLSPEHQDRIIGRVRDLLTARPYRVLRISWFGGEPLLGLNVIRALTPRLLALAEEFGCKYGSLMVTNALTLTEALATELVRTLQIREFQITLDGTAEFHNTRRYTRKGASGTFGRIFANTVSLARRTDLTAEVILRFNVDRRNVAGIRPLIRALAEAGVVGRFADVQFAPVHDWGNDAGSLALPSEEFARLELEWLSELIVLGFTPPRLVPKRREVQCMAVRPRALLVNPYGRLYNCTEPSLIPAPPPVNAGQGRYPIPVLSSTAEVYRIGDLETGELPGRRGLLGDFNDRVARGEYLCHTCRMLPVCGGGCPKHWLEGKMPCPSTRYNIEYRLLLSYAIPRLGGIE